MFVPVVNTLVLESAESFVLMTYWPMEILGRNWYWYAPFSSPLIPAKTNCSTEWGSFGYIMESLSLAMVLF